ncbi:MAG: AMP-binding protein, partial [Fimbriimonadaceae bacterium]|nr:AMP-binding protein [Alphaproteobacteria bacterium]
ILDLYFACARLGAILVPLNWRLAAPELEYIIRDCAPKVLIADADFRPVIESIYDRMANCHLVGYGAHDGNWLNYEDLLRGVDEAAVHEPVGPEVNLGCPFLIVYTSGTTGRPKGAVLSQNAVTWNAVNSAHLHDMTSADKVLNFLPMFHVGGLNIQTTPALHAGATVVIQRAFDPGETLRLIREERPTLVVNVPATMQALLAHPDWKATDFSCLRVLITGSTNVPEPIIRAYQKRNIPVGQVYGSSETAPIAICLRGEDGFRKTGSTGKPALHCEVRLVDKNNREPPTGQPGEILIRGPNVLTEYWNNPEETAAVFQDDWFRTGDIAYHDEEGFYWIVDREKDLIISGSENIYPAELEAVLAEHPQIQESAVVARPDEKWGEVAVAIIVRKEGSTLDAAEALKIFDGVIARYKHPRDVMFVDALPRNVMGKILKYQLRNMLMPDER